MAINPGRCGWCNTEAPKGKEFPMYSLATGRPPKFKFRKDIDKMVAKEDFRYLCWPCAQKHVTPKGIKERKVKTAGETPLFDNPSKSRRKAA